MIDASDRARRLGRSVLGRALFAVAVLAVSIAPVAAAGGPTKLSEPSVTPSNGLTTSPITFEVTYRNRQGSEPDYVRVLIGAKAYPMEPASASSDYKSGVVYRLVTKVPAGTWTVAFQAADRERFTDELPGSTLVIKPPPPPKPTPTPTPAPTPAPTPTPTSDAAPGATPLPSGDPAPSTPGGWSRILLDPLTVDWPIGGIAPGPVPGPGTPPDAGQTPDPSPDPGGAVVPSAPGRGFGPGSGGSSPGSSGGQSGSPMSGGSGSDSALADRSATAVLMRVLPTLAATTGGVTMMMAFLVFGKRRRDEEPTAPDDVLRAAASLGSGIVPDAGIATLPMLDPDGHLPRWRRPSLLEARKADPLREDRPTVRLTFESAAASSEIAGLERRVIRYRLVSLLDSPDEVRGTELATLDQGDEVIVLEKRGTFLRILCPDGRQGWLHRMTLGEVVIDSPAATRTESWTSGDEGPGNGSSFADVIRAHELRRQQTVDAS